MHGPFAYRDGALCAGAVPLAPLAERYGTPLYVYDFDAIAARYHAFSQALGDQPHRICYAVKANSSLALLARLARLGAGFDIVSGGELARVLAAGGDPAKVVFSGVGKSTQELKDALAAGIGCFNVESEPELWRLGELAAAAGVVAPVSLRVNPDVDPETHPYISTGLKDNKFGLAVERAAALYPRLAEHPHLDPVGIDFHIGSQLTSLSPFIDALRRVLALVDQLEEGGLTLKHIDVGGGLGVRYDDEAPPSAAAYGAGLKGALQGRPQTLVLEPGRWLVAEAGALLTTVEYEKHHEGRRFLIVDAAMTELLRPALYNAWHPIVPLVEPAAGAAAPQAADIVGPVCESSDVLGRDRAITAAAGDRLAILAAGAYGFGMASNYNTRNRPAEVLLEQGEAYLVRRRERYEDQLALETLALGESA
jgi:diaminopimelate decarboxylase